MTVRVMFYVQHLLGIGHLARASLICDGMVRQGFDVKMVMGGAPVEGFPHPGTDVDYLPVLKAGCFRFNDLTDACGNHVDDQYLNSRRDRLMKLFAEYQPDILVIEAFPFGRRQMRFELIPLLEAAKQVDWQPLVASSVRDIVQEKKKPKRLQETVATLVDYFDILMVHGDPNFVTLDKSFSMTDKIDHLIQYTGMVSAEIPPLTGDAYDVVVSAGGGAAGEIIMSTAYKARPLTNLADAQWSFITGPNLPEETTRQLLSNCPKNVEIETHRTDFRAVLANARLSISQAGYNTTADILKADCPAILVPFSSGGETEQSFRADRLEQRGLATCVAEDGLTPERLATAIDRAAKSAPTASQQLPIALDGAEQSAHVLRQAWEAR